MTLSTSHRLVAGAALVGAAGTGWWLSVPAEDLLPPVRPRAAAQQPLAAPWAAPSTAPQARARAWPEPGAEALRAWSGQTPQVLSAPRTAAAKPVMAATASAASAAPQAPAPAWRFVGRITDGAAVRAMLVTQRELRVVSEQEALDADWRVERIGEQGVELRWLPGDQRVRLAWAAS